MLERLHTKFDFFFTKVTHFWQQQQETERGGSVVNIYASFERDLRSNQRSVGCQQIHAFVTRKNMLNFLIKFPIRRRKNIVRTHYNMHHSSFTATTLSRMLASLHRVPRGVRTVDVDRRCSTLGCMWDAVELCISGAIS
jgi:hypothetical protein